MLSQPPPQELQGVKIELEILNPPKPMNPSSSPSSLDSTAIHKVSNSDDEDILEQSRVFHQDINTNKGGMTHLSRGPPSVEHRNLSGATRPAVAYKKIRAAYPAPELLATSINEATQYRSPYAVAEHEQKKPSSPIEKSSGSDLPRGVYTSVQMYKRVPPGPLPHHLDSATPKAPDKGRLPPRCTVMLPQHMTQPPHQTDLASPPYVKSMRKSQHMSQLAPHTGKRLPPANLIGTQIQRERLSTVARGMALPSYVAYKDNQRPSFNMENESLLGLPEGAEAQGYVQMRPTPNKHTATPPRNDVTKRSKNYSVFEPVHIDLPYQTTKVIRMPTRNDVASGQELPEPTPDNLPYGDTEDYQSCMLIYWLDEKELSYREGTELFRQRFPTETANYNTIRRRHLGTLQRLAKKYGLKPTNEIMKPGFKVLRRGRLAGAKNSTIGGRVLEPTTATHVAANALVETAGAENHTSAVTSLWTQSQTNEDWTGYVRIKSVTQPLATRGLMFACIVVWKDTEGASYEQIQKRLVDGFNWKLGITTIRKVYYEERPRVYDVRHNARDGAHVDLEAKVNAVDTIGTGKDATEEDARIDVAGSQAAHGRSL